MKIKFIDGLPVFLQIMADIKADIVAGKLPVGSRLPSVRSMAEAYEVNPNTMHRVYQLLEQEGLAYTQRGSGTYIKDDEAIILSIRREMIEGIVSRYVSDMGRLGLGGEQMQHELTDYLSHREGVHA